MPETAVATSRSTQRAFSSTVSTETNYAVIVTTTTATGAVPSTAGLRA